MLQGSGHPIASLIAASQIINSPRATAAYPSLSYNISISISVPLPPSLVCARPMNQSGWQRAAVRDSARAITHVEPGQDLSGLSRHRGKRGASGRFQLSPPFLSFLHSFLHNHLLLHHFATLENFSM